jgi:glucose-6-phosphate isomerase
MIKKLQQLAMSHQTFSIKNAFVNDENRAADFSLSAANLYLDYGFQNISTHAMDSLLSWGKTCELSSQINAMRRGDKINHTEQRAVLHSMLRDPQPTRINVLGETLAAEVENAEQRMATIVNQLHQGELTGFNGQAFTDVVAIGIGGSYYGPMVCAQALKAYTNNDIGVHYLANVDGDGVQEKLSALNPASTLVVIVSKTFVTQETLLNANAVKQWLLDGGCEITSLAKHFVAVSSNVKNASEFGIAQDRILPMWDWVGGRF